MFQFRSKLTQGGVRVEVRVRPGGDVVSLYAPGSETVLDLPEEITRHLFVTT